MNPALMLGIVSVLLIAIIVIQVSRMKKSSEHASGRRFFSSGGLLFLAAFCAYGFLSAGELNGDAERNWKIGYGVLGGVSFAGAVFQAWKKR